MTSEERSGFIFNYYEQARSDPYHLYAREPIIQLVPDPEEPALGQDESQVRSIQRNETQLAALRTKGISVSDPVFGSSLEWKYRTFYMHPLSLGDNDNLLDSAPNSYTNGDMRNEDLQEALSGSQAPATAGLRLCLFNVIVALEWTPDKAYLRQLEWAFRRASDLLYDVTDGYMAFGQVVFGGRELMDCADIQIMASNRILPRSWVGGLIEATKYQPIRMGRGVWHERNQVSIPWEEPEGYRTLIHEWAHYALFLRDKYLETRPFKSSGESTPQAPVTVPKRRLTSISIMETLEGTSELVSQVSTSKCKQDEAWQTIDQHYPWLRQEQTARPTAMGPRQLPLPLPRFHYLGAVAASRAGSQPAKALLHADSIPTFAGDNNGSDVPSKDSGFLSRYWVYVVRPDPSGGYERMIAQGTLDARSAEEPFDLLGGAAGDIVLLFTEPHHRAPAAFQGTLTPSSEDGQELSVSRWDPIAVDSEHIIDVVPFLPEQLPGAPTSEPPSDEPAGLAWVSVRVRNAGQDAEPQAWLFPHGQMESQQPLPLARIKPEDAAQMQLDASVDWISEPRHIPTLDGHVLVKLGESTAVSTFSQGGGPPTHTGIPTNPITAGSSDGEAMLFFNTAEVAPNYSRFKVVTNMIHGVCPKDPLGIDPRSALYSVATNHQLPRTLGPTLVIYYDTPYQNKSSYLRLYGLKDDGAWKRLEAEVSTSGRFVTVPLSDDTISDDGTGTRLSSDDAPRLRVECFRLYGAPMR